MVNLEIMFTFTEKSIPYQKKKSRQKLRKFFDSDEFFCRLCFLPTKFYADNEFLPTNILTNIFGSENI